MVPPSSGRCLKNNSVDNEEQNRSSPDWESIVRSHGPMAFDTAWRLLGDAADAEDVVQDALLDAFRLHSTSTIENWGGLLRHLVSCRAIDRLRARKSAVSIIDDSIAGDSIRPEAAAIDRELAAQLRTAITRLTDREAQLLSLRYFAEMANVEIAGALGISPDAVGVALHKARKKLKEILSTEHVRKQGVSK